VKEYKEGDNIIERKGKRNKKRERAGKKEIERVE